VNWDFLVQQLVSGLTLGSMYALIALGYTMVYGILKLLNFAHGEVYMMGAFAGLGVMTALGGPDAPIVPVAWVCGYAEAPNGMTMNGENLTSIPQGLLPVDCRALSR